MIHSYICGVDNNEVTFKDLENASGTIKAGYEKIPFCGGTNKKRFWPSIISG